MESGLSTLAEQTWGADYWLGVPERPRIEADPGCCCWFAFHLGENEGRWAAWGYGLWVRFDDEGEPVSFEISTSPVTISSTWAGQPTEKGLRTLLKDYMLNGPACRGPF